MFSPRAKEHPTDFITWGNEASDWLVFKMGLYLNVEGSGAGDDLKQVVSQKEIPDGDT